MPTVLNHLSDSEYASYYKKYLEKVAFEDPVKLLIEDLEKQLKIIESLNEDQLSYRYKKGNGQSRRYLYIYVTVKLFLPTEH